MTGLRRDYFKRVHYSPYKNDNNVTLAGFPTRKPFLPFAQRYALTLATGWREDLDLPLTSRGFVDWYASGDDQVRFD